MKREKILKKGHFRNPKTTLALFAMKLRSNWSIFFVPSVQTGSTYVSGLWLRSSNHTGLCCASNYSKFELRPSLLDGRRVLEPTLLPCLASCLHFLLNSLNELKYVFTSRRFVFLSGFVIGIRQFEAGFFQNCRILALLHRYIFD